jgi:hypothetical protein
VCVIVYSDLFLNLMIECELILACMSLPGEVCDTPAHREKFIIIPAWQEML